MRTRLVVIATALLASSTVLPVSAAAQEVLPADEVPVLHPPAPRGTLVVAPAPDRAPSAKVVDGDPSDWVGESARVGGASRYDAGELVHTDFLYDAYGADDGTDAS